MRRYILFMILLLAGGSIFASVINEGTDTLRASVVRGERSAKPIVREASRDFSRNQTDYYASFLIVRTISAGGKFREAQSARVRLPGFQPEDEHKTLLGRPERDGAFVRLRHIRQRESFC